MIGRKYNIFNWFHSIVPNFHIWPALIGGAATLGGAAMSTFGSKKPKVKTYNPLDIGHQTLGAQTQLLPLVAEQEDFWRPQMTDIGVRGMEHAFGRLRKGIGEATDFSAKQSQQAMQKYAPGYASMVRQLNPELYETLGLATGQYKDLMADAQATRGPTEIEETLRGQALSDLQLGRQLDPREARDLEQATRGGFQARGRAVDNAAIAQDVLNRYRLGTEAEQRRRGFAMGANQMFRQGQQQDRAYGLDVGRFGLGVGQLGIASKINPLLAPGLQQAMTMTPGAMLGMAGQYATSQPTLFNPFDPAGNALLTGGISAQNQAAAAQQANRAQMGAGLMGLGSNILTSQQGMAGLGKIGSGIAGMFGGGSNPPIDAGFSMGSGVGKGYSFGQ